MISRTIIYPKDVCKITGKSIRHAQKELKTIKLAYNKLEHQSVTYIEYGEYKGIDPEIVKTYLK